MILKVKNSSILFSFPFIIEILWLTQEFLIFSKIGLKSTQIYFASENLLTWTNLGIYKNSFDPEFDPNTQATRRYPITRSYTIGLRVLF